MMGGEKIMECNGIQCSTTSSSSCKGCPPGGSCDCPSCSGQNPIDFAVIMWHKAAMAALLEVKKDRIKQRLEKSFGQTLDKGADAVVEAIKKKIQSAVLGSSSEQELRGKLASILSESTK